MRILVLALTVAVSALGPVSGDAVGPYPAAVHIAKEIGKRTAGSKQESRAHRYVVKQFLAAGLEVQQNGFTVPGHGKSRNVIGIFETPKDCLELYIAHADSVARGQGANDNASGLGVIVALAPRLAKLAPDCDVWLVATGAEEREFTGTGYHVGSQALVGFVQGRNRGADLRYALSLDMLGRGKRFYLRSPQPSVRDGVEGEILAAARKARVTIRWSRDSGDGNSDHREFELAGLPGAVLQVWRGHDPCHHEGCDSWTRIEKKSLRLVQRAVEELISP